MSEPESPQGERGARRAGRSELARTGLSEERALSPAIFEIAVREDTRPVVPGRPPVPRWALLAPLPAVLGVLAVLVVPLGATVLASLRRDGRFAGLAEYGSLLDDQQVTTAWRNSLLWVCFALVLSAAGLGLAELVRRAGGTRALVVAVLAAPTAVSALVAGIAFRLLFDPDPDRGPVAAVLGRIVPGAGTDFLAPPGIAVVLGSAFAWAWVGLAVVVLGAGLRALPADRLRMARAAGVRPLGRLWTVVLPAIRPVLAVVVLTLLVAAARIFDLVLVAVPGSVQQAAGVVGLQWWRREGDLTEGQRAALVVLLTVLLAVAAAVASGLGSTRQSLASPEPGEPPPPRSRAPLARWAARLALAVAVLLWLVPFGVLLATSLRDPASVPLSGWWSGGGWTLASYRDAFATSELASALAGSAWVAAGATVLLLALAFPAAYALAWGGLRRRPARAVVVVSAVLAVLPVQAYAVPVGSALGHLRALGAPTVLAVVHAVIGLPFAVLLLRGAFVTVPAGEVVRARLDGGEWQAAWAVAGLRRQSLVAVAVLEFVLVWNDLVVGLLLGGPGSRLATLALLEQTRQFATNAGTLAATSVVLTAVPLTLLLVTGRWLVRGLAAGVAR
ncbi:MAG TPA: hypothetical protein VF109_00945 [Mycobacteriales bacterium]